MATKKIKFPINLNSIFVTVTCAECQKTYSVMMKRPVFGHNCHCGYSTFLFKVVNNPGEINVTAQYAGKDGFPSEYPLTPMSIEVDTNE